ncbi:MAG: hypothetical protein U1B30_04920, partial [Pseudomonadota bacterium]|nr:hypothetical protein [Pseudomonadota bacterium]
VQAATGVTDEDDDDDDETAGVELDALVEARTPWSLPPPQATKPMMQVLSRLVFRLINGVLLLRLVIADSLIVSIFIV